MEDDADQDEALENMFSGEESLGRYLDLHLLYDQFVNLKSIEKVPYTTYLLTFQNLAQVPKSVKRTSEYKA